MFAKHEWNIKTYFAPSNIVQNMLIVNQMEKSQCVKVMGREYLCKACIIEFGGGN